MPGWREGTKAAEAEGRFRSIGIVEEQHPDRARLFLQWKNIPWPVMVDALDLLNVPYVPITILIDENGIIRTIAPPLSPPPQELEAGFGGAAPAGSAPPVSKPPGAMPGPPPASGAAGVSDADALFLWGGVSRLGEAIAAYEGAVASKPRDGAAHFRLGVALRRRYDSEARQPGDFQRAAAEWGRALDLEPNDYIWRRRIEQYGPRLDKPYPFYDWVAEARRDITARGETPVALAAEPGGAELAGRATSFTAATAGAAEPDPQGRITRDAGAFIRVDGAIVPARIPPGGAARVHLTFQPNDATQAHWNNEASDMVLWINPPPGFLVDSRRMTLPRPREPVSREVRTLEFEVKTPPGVRGSFNLPGYALYYVCEDVKGTCLYRRQDLSVKLDTQPAAANRSVSEK